jgi:hypothetical protein|tara:strand:+ start:19 stop:603 length:585 start_codon:yes stop_codon:yes gene_type:complete
MGINSTEVSYGFGQFGSAFTDTAANTIRPPEELVIVAIQFLADTALDDVRIAGDLNIYPNTSTAANSQGNFTRKVNQGTGASTKIIFDDTNTASGVTVGDEVYDAEGVLFGTVTVLDPDGDNDNEITVSSSNTITDDELLSFVTPSTIAFEGVGGQAVDGTQVFPKGLTIYGRWDSVSMNADDPNGGIICYFGK